MNGLTGFGMYLGCEDADNLREGLLGVCLVVTDGNAGGQDTIIGLDGGGGGGKVCGEFIQFAGADPVVNAGEHLLGN